MVLVDEGDLRLEELVGGTCAARGQPWVVCCWERNDQSSVVAVLCLLAGRREIGLYRAVDEKNTVAGELQGFLWAMDRYLRGSLRLVTGHWGVQGLRGIFAFVLWDAKTGAMYLVRGRLGIKPLYYTVLDGRLIFGSEIKAILAHGGVPRAVRPDAVKIVDTLAWHYDEPFGDYLSIPTYYVSQAARRHVTVALSGDGGDENFAGYRRYRFDLAERRVRRLLPGPLRRGVLRPIGWAYPKGDWLPQCLRAKVTLQNLCVDAPAAYCRSVGFLADEQKPAFYTADMARAVKGYRSDDLIRGYMACAGAGDLDQLLYTDMKTYLVDDILTKVDRASMAVSLEVRVPLLDHRFVAFARQVPAAMKIQRGQGKAILKSAMRPYLDDETLYRPSRASPRRWANGCEGPCVRWRPRRCCHRGRPMSILSRPRPSRRSGGRTSRACGTTPPCCGRSWRSGCGPGSSCGPERARERDETA